LTESPNFIDADDTESMKAAGWDDQGIYEATALISYFNMTGRLEAASGLPEDQIPVSAKMAEALGS
jgi:alkylhydroperoxidase family enzyme